MTTPLAAGTRYRVLDAWRGICACLVTIVHIPVAHRWQGTNTFHNMQLFVDFFFVLSGFVIAYAYADRLQRTHNWQGFMIRRFGRIYPLHVAILAVLVAQELAKLAAYVIANMTFDGVPFSASRSLETLLSNLLLTQAMGLHGTTSWNFPAWSIGVEFYTYVAFAIAVLVLGARPVVYAALSLFGLFVVAAYSPQWLFGTHDFGFFRCLYGFFLGCLVSAYLQGRQQPLAPAPKFATLAEFGAGGLLVVYLLLAGEDATSLAAPLVFAVIIVVFSLERGAVSRLLLSKAAQALGAWSYSIYMIHSLLFVLIKIVLSVLAAKGLLPLTSSFDGSTRLWSFGNTPADSVLVGSYLAVVIFCASYSYAWVEAPARDWFGRIADKVSRAQPAARSQPKQMAAV